MKQELKDAIAAKDEAEIYRLALAVAQRYWSSERWRNVSAMERDAAEVRYLDDVQQAMSAGTLDHRRNPFAYLTTCARNAMLLVIRTKQRRRNREEEWAECQALRRDPRDPATARIPPAQQPATSLLMGGGGYQPKPVPTGFHIPDWLMSRGDVSPGAKLMWALVVQRQGPMSSEEIAAELCVSSRTVRTWKQQLRAVGLLRWAQPGPQSPPIYCRGEKSSALGGIHRT